MSMHWNSYGKYLLTGVVLGSFLFYAPSVTEAKRAHKAPQSTAEVTVAVPDVVETKAQRPARKHQAEPKIGIHQDLRGEDSLHATSERSCRAAVTSSRASTTSSTRRARLSSR